MADEELPDPHPGGSRWLRVLGWAAAVLVGGALLLRAIDHQHPAGRPPPTPSSTPAVAQTLPPVRPALPLPVRDNRFGYGPYSCPPGGDGSPACELVQNVPAAVLDAVRQHLPAAREVAAFEEQLRDVGFGPGGLWYREVDLRQGRIEVMIQVIRQSGTARRQAVRRAGRHVLIVTGRDGGFAVRIRSTGSAPRRVLVALAADDRLRAAG